MIELLRILGFGSFLAASAVVGTRLLLLARRTRQLPETALGLALALAGTLGWALLFLSSQGEGALGLPATWLRGAGILSTALGSAGLWVFTWRVFRPDATWARALCAAGIAAALVGVAGEGLAGGFARDQRGLWFWLGFAGRSLPFGWASVESFGYYRRMQRQAVLGLGDVGVQRRLLLWGVGSGAAAAIFAVGAATILWTSAASPLARPLPSILASVLGLVAAVSFWQAFFPGPRGHEERRPCQRPQAPLPTESSADPFGDGS